MAGVEQPDRSHVASDRRLTIISNAVTEPLLAHLRDQTTGAAAFTATAEQLARLLLYEAARDLPLQPHTVIGFDGHLITVQRLAVRVAGLVILRAGLAFAPTFRELFPDCPLHQVGLRRDEATLVPTTYANNLPEQPDWADVVLLLDPMLATGGSARAAVDLLRVSHGGAVIVVSFVSAPYGVDAVLRHDPGCRIVTLALDECLNEAGYILPGLGDAGDRYFGTL
jgi:uracil phosphoribosyltransferase